MKGIFNTSRLLAAALAVAGLFGCLGAGAADRIEFVHTDALGSPVAVTDENGVVIRRTEYEPYGAVVGGEVADGPGYTGHVADSATGLSYMQQRYMDPELGAFLSVDPVTAYELPVPGFNRYRYANGSPYSYTDPDGRRSISNTVSGSLACQVNPLCRFALGDDSGKRSKSTASVLKRHRTPSSQLKLMESVGGDVQTMKLAQDTHRDFVGAAIGVFGGGGLSGLGRSGTSTLYRAVTAGEAESVRATGRFSVGPNSLGGKWFAETLQHARTWGGKMNGPGASTILKVKIPRSTADQMMRMERLDGIGPARYGEMNQLGQAVIKEVK